MENAMRTLKQIGIESLTTSAAKGFQTVTPADWEDPSLVPIKLSLVHSEVSEALEEWRKEHRLEEFGGELADIIIRVTQLGIGLGIDLDEAVADKQEKNRTREFQHGGRRI